MQVPAPFRRRAHALIVVTVAVAAVAARGDAVVRTDHSVARLPPDRPNVLLLVSDDQTYANFTRDLMPNVFAQLVDHGVDFTRAYVNSSLCCPSRAEIMTGLYEHHTGVDLSDVALDRPRIVEALHDLGYRTQLAGKYLNSYPCQPPLPEFDQWVCQGEGQSSYSMVDPNLNVDGEWIQFKGYTTDILADFVVDFIDATPQDQPFFAMYTPTSPHLPADDPRCQDIEVAPNRPPSYDEDTLADGKPDYLKRGPLNDYEVGLFDDEHGDMTRAVPCLDASIGTILSSLGDREQDTVVFFLSDHGYLYGEHRWEGKMNPHEEAVHVPFVVRYPALVPEGAPLRSAALVQNVDIAATIADLVGIHWGADGRSLVPLLTQERRTVRTGALVEHCEGVSYPCWGYELSPGGRVIPTTHFGIVSARYKYVEYITGERELYDRAADPFELANLDGDPAYAAVEADLAHRLAALTAPPMTDTTIVGGPLGPASGRAFGFTYFSQSRHATYRCRLDHDGARGPWVACNGQSHVVGSLGDGSYTFRVQGTDENGVMDPTPDTRTFSIASTGPDVSITAAPAPHLQDDVVSFEFGSEAPGVRFECRLAEFGTEAAWLPCDAQNGVAYGPLHDAVWSFEVRAVDGDVASDPPAEWLFQVDNAGPVMTFTRSPLRPTNDTSATFSFYPDEPVAGRTTCRLDMGPSIDCSSMSFDAADLEETEHVLLVRATDELGNVGTTAYSWIVDLTPPVATISGGPPPVWNRDEGKFTLSSSEPLDAMFRCALDSGVLVDCPAHIGFEGLADGPHTFTAVAIDRAVNLSAPATWSWVQDTVPPNERAGNR